MKLKLVPKEESMPEISREELQRYLLKSLKRLEVLNARLKALLKEVENETY